VTNLHEMKAVEKVIVRMVLKNV